MGTWGHKNGTHWWADRDWFVEHNTRTEKTNLPPVCIHCEAFVGDARMHLETVHGLTPYAWGGDR